MCVLRGVILLGLLPAPGCCPDGPPSCEPGTQQTWCWCDKLLAADGHTDTSASTTGFTSSTQSPTSGGTSLVDTTSGSASTTSSNTSGETLALETTDSTGTSTSTTSGEASTTVADPEPCCGEQHFSAPCDGNLVAKEGLLFAYRLSLTERCLAGNISITVSYGEIDAVLSDTSDMIIHAGIFDDSTPNKKIWWSDAWTIPQGTKVDPSPKEWIVPLGMDNVPEMLPSTVWLALRFKHASEEALCLPVSDDNVEDAESVKFCFITEDPMDPMGLQATLETNDCIVPDPPRYLAFSLTGDCSP